MNNKFAYLFFILFFPFIGVPQTRYKNIEVTGPDEYGAQINNVRERCTLRAFLKITNITDSVLIVSRSQYGNVHYLGGDAIGAVILPGYSYLFPVGVEPTHRIEVLIYKIDTADYARNIDQGMSLPSDLFETENIWLENVSDLIRSIDPESDTTILKSNCMNFYKDYLKWNATSIPDTSKIEISGISEFGFFIQNFKKSADNAPFKIQIGDTYYDNNNTGSYKSISGILTIKNTSTDTIYIDKIVFDTPKGQSKKYVFEKTKHIKNGVPVRKRKKKHTIFDTAGIIDTYVNMDHYYVPPGCSAAYYFWYTCLFKDENSLQEDFFEMYNTLPGHIYFNNGTTMSFTLDFDQKHLIQRISQIIFK